MASKNVVLKDTFGNQIFPATTAEQVSYDATKNMKQALDTVNAHATVANEAANMTDETKIYVYTGSETGYTYGHWYYHDGSTWTDGGVYMSGDTDTTLSLSGIAADAAVVGDAVTEITDTLDDLSTAIVTDKTLSISDKAADSKKVGDAITEILDRFDDLRIRNNLPQLRIYGDISVMTATKNEPKIYNYIWIDPAEKEQRAGFCSMKWQGESSLTYPKKNYTIKFFHDAGYKRKDKTSFFDKLILKKNKWVVKANWVDRSMSRNIVSCRLWGQLVKSRKTAPIQPFEDAPNYGAINGYPIEIYVNDSWHGLYTFNIPKDEDLFGMDAENPLHCAICGDSQSGSGSTAFRSATKNGWELEVPDAWQSYTVEEDGVEVTKYVSDGLVALINFVMTASDADFKENLNTYLDVESAIDYYLMTYLDCGIDSLGRNLVLLTYDGGSKWYCSLYDADTTWGNGLKGAASYNATLPCPEQYEMKTSLLWERLEANFGQELYDRWMDLRKNIFTADYIKNQFSLFWNDIEEDVYQHDVERWENQDAQRPHMPQWNVDFKARMFAFIENRITYCDNEIKGMRSPVPCTGIALNQSTITFTSGTPVTLTATIEPENTTDEVVWTVSDDTVVTVDNGVVYPVQSGNATITATCGQQSATCSVTVMSLTFTVTLVGSHSSLSPTTDINPNAAYHGTLTADANYTFTSVVVTMGGVDITSSCYSNGSINIATVTSDIVVTAVTEYQWDTTNLEFSLSSPLTMNGSNYVDTEFAYDGLSALTIAIDLIQPDDLTTSERFILGAMRSGTYTAGWETAARTFRGINNRNVSSGLAATAQQRVRAVLRYNPDTNVMSVRSSADDVVLGTVEKTTTNSHTTGASTNVSRDAFVNSMYLGGLHGANGLTNATDSGTVNDLRIYTRRWTDAEVATWLGLESLSDVFIDDKDQN